METFYGYTTALWYWRVAAYRGATPRRVSRSIVSGGYAYTSAQEAACRPNWLDPLLLDLASGEVHVLSFEKTHRSAQQSPIVHNWGKVPHDAFCPAGEGSFVASPEFCFLQMAETMEFHELVVLGMELCGFYCIDPTEEEGFGERLEPLTTVARIGAFLEDNPGLRGRRAAQTALQYVADGAASPMESAVYLTLCLPYKRGGYGLPRPQLNYRIDLDADARKLHDAIYCLGDLCWPTKGLDLEYLGVSSHEGNSKMIADRNRTLAIAQMGYEVVEITKSQALDSEAFELVVKRVAAKLGKRVQKGAYGLGEERRRLVEAAYRWLGNVAPTPEAHVGAMDEEPVFGRGV